MTDPAIESKIWQALKARVLSLPTSYPLAMPLDDAFEKPSDDEKPLPYIEIRHMPNTNNRLMIKSDGKHDRPGILQLALFMPVAMKRTYEQSLEIAADLASWFPTDEKMTFQGVTVRVEKAPDISQPYREDAYNIYPVTIRYQTYA